MNDICQQINDGNLVGYFFEKDNQVDIFLPEGFSIKKFKSDLNFINKNIYELLKDILNNEGILKQENIYLNDVGYIYLITKIIDNTIININILPKIVKLNNSKPILYNDLGNLNSFLMQFNVILNSYKTYRKDVYSFKKNNQKRSVLLEFETDLNILKKIHSIINNQLINHAIEERLIISDMLIGEIDTEQLKFNLEGGVIPQKIRAKNLLKICSIIYSCIFNKYNSHLLLFLKKNKHNEIINSLFIYLNKIKNHSFFQHNNIIKHSPPEIKKALNDKDDTFKDNKELAVLLKNLNTNNIDVNNSYNYQKKTLKLEKIWEKFIENNLKNQYPKISFQGIKQISRNEKNQVYFSDSNYDSESEVDVIWENSLMINGKNIYYYDVADAKYKVLNNSPLPSDIDKLKRDLEIHNMLHDRLSKKEINIDEYLEIRKTMKAYLLYPTIINIDISYDNKVVVQDKAIDLYNGNFKQIDFSKNPECKDINMYSQEVEFVQVKKCIE